MRKILFRGKSEFDGEWSEGLLLWDESYEPPAPVIVKGASWVGGMINDWSIRFIFVFPETVGQYTGLRDRDGNPIFEGDIVRFNDPLDDKHLAIVKYGTFDCSDKYSVYGFYFENLDGSKSEFFQCKIIGNIYDNPELLERKNEK